MFYLIFTARTVTSSAAPWKEGFVGADERLIRNIYVRVPAISSDHMLTLLIAQTNAKINTK